jgi:hypothetical protein
MKNTVMTLDQVKEVAPSVFATSASPKVSNRYTFVPTVDIVENFQREGWEIASVKQTGKGIHGLHEVKFRNGELPNVGDTLVEAIIRNSHNGTSTLSVSAGLFRLCCSNGLTVATSAADSFKVRHAGFELDDVKRITEDFAKKLPLIEGSVNRMMERELTIDEKIDFVRKSAEVRWKTGSVPATLDYEEILNPLRDADNGDSLWQVFNVVQEKWIRGGIQYKSNKGRKTQLRTLSDILTTNIINTKLWELAEEMV